MKEYERRVRQARRRDAIRRVITAAVAWGLLLLGVAAFMFLFWLLIGLSIALFGKPIA